MPKYPDAVWRPVDRYQQGELRIRIQPRRFVHHTAVSAAASMHDFFNQDGQPTPHFYVNETGGLEQYIDTDYRATACLDGNHDCIAIESWDNGAPGGKVPPWTGGQVETIAKLLAWCHSVHGIPLERLSSSKPGTTGVGWHRHGCDGNFGHPLGSLLGGRVDGGERWTESFGKQCPGDAKIRGVVALIIPRAIQIKSGDDDMQFNDEIPGTDGKTVGDALRGVFTLREQFAVFRANDADRDAALLAAVDALPDRQLSKKEVRDALARELAATTTEGTP